MNKHQENQKIKEELESILDRLSHSSSSDQYAKIAKGIFVANYATFLAIVWKSFEMHGNIPWLAKVSLVFFGLGCALSSIQVVADYLGEQMEQLPDFRRLVEIDEGLDENSQDFLDEDLYQQIKMSAKLFRLSEKKVDTSQIPAWVMSWLYVAINIGALIASFALLFLGMLSLAISVWF